ncbi:MAG: DUF1449 family protein [Sphingomonas bacterium]
MFAQLLTPAYAPFSIAFVVMIGIGLIEAIGPGFGHLDSHGDIHAEAEGGFLDWLGLGRELPILIWLTSLLGCFALVGIAIQQIASTIIGTPLHWSVAVGGAFLGGGMLNTLAANGLARIMPGFETSAITTDELLRLRGTILEGAARRGNPARAKVVDQFGQAHFVMVEPHADGDHITQGETALLVRREGNLFFAIPDQDPLFRPI